MGMKAKNLIWRRSSLCGTATCLEVAADADAVLLRDAKDPDGPWLEFEHVAWRSLIAGIKGGEFGDVARTR